MIVMVFEIFLLFAIVFICMSIVYSTVRLGIPPMPSSKKAYNAVIELIDETSTGTIIDLGSGWGNFVIPIAKRYPQRQIVGYEMSLLPWLTSVLLKYVFGLKNLTLCRQNFFDANITTASILVCYLFPEAMSRIESEFLRENTEVEYLISNNFALPSLQFDKVIRLNDFYKSPVYLYRIN